MEIAAITGHAVGDVRSIMDKCYFNRDPAMAVRQCRSLKREQSLQTVLRDATQKGKSGQKPESFQSVAMVGAHRLELWTR
jgi:hypothetical protein